MTRLELAEKFLWLASLAYAAGCKRLGRERILDGIATLVVDGGKVLFTGELPRVRLTAAR